MILLPEQCDKMSMQFSSKVSHLTELHGQFTARSRNRDPVGKHLRHICQIRFLTLGGAPNFQMTFHQP